MGLMDESLPPYLHEPDAQVLLGAPLYRIYYGGVVAIHSPPSADGCSQIRAQLYAERAEFGRVLPGAHERALQSSERLAGFALQAFDRFGLDLCWFHHDPRTGRGKPLVNRN